MRSDPDAAPDSWDERAAASAGWVARRYPADPAAAADDPLPSRVLALLGDVTGREVLDACSGLRRPEAHPVIRGSIRA